jgi:hypothetical protein
LSLISLVRVRPRWAEWGIFLPAIAWTLFLMTAKINIGFRHWLAPYAFWLMLCARAAAPLGIAWRALAWTCIVGAAAHVARFHPDYLSYINAPRRHVWEQINDSNLDWGQSLKEVRRWIDAHARGREITVVYFGHRTIDASRYLGDDVHVRVLRWNDEIDAPPTRGIVIISPAMIIPLKSNVFAALRAREPVDVIGHSMLVFDLDR